MRIPLLRTPALAFVTMVALLSCGSADSSSASAGGVQPPTSTTGAPACAGGFGGGGLGGTTIGIAHLVELPVMIEEVAFFTGQPGKGGPGGSTVVSFPGTEGQDGVAASVQSFPAP